MPADILLYGLIAAGLVFWLRNILGTRHGDERSRPNPFTGNPDGQSNRPDNKHDNKNGNTKAPTKSGAGLDLASGRGSKMGAGIVALSSDASSFQDGLDANMAITPDAEAGLLSIVQHDRGFHARTFLYAAQDAFTMIIEAFAAADRDTLKTLLAPSVLSAFSSVLDQREKDGQKADVEIHAIRKAEITQAWVEGKKTAFITVRFVADETNILHDKDGERLYGHPDRVTETIDIWTFGRNVKSRDPVWYLHQTKDEDAGDQDHKTVPDGK